MYTEFFGLNEPPFTITPDPRYLYVSMRHQEALAHLLYGIKESDGFVQLTGEVGTGKTTLTRALLEQLPPNVDVALILNPKLTAWEFVASLCDEFAIDYPKAESIKSLVDALNVYLLTSHAANRRSVLIVDEAQNLDAEVLEQIRLLTNLETSKHKLLHIVLVGQPELRELLARNEMRQLAQRITARYHLIALTEEETRDYIQHRLKVAGSKRPLFSKGAIHQIFKLSTGIPRVINVLCDRALLGAYAHDINEVDSATVRQAAAEIEFTVQSGRVKRYGVLAAATLLLALGVGWVIGYLSTREMRQDLTVASLSTPVGPDVSMDKETTPDPVLLAAPLEEKESVMSVAQLLSNAATATEDLGFAALFAQWHFNYQDLTGATACEKAVSRSLKCLKINATWKDLLRINFPALIKLSAPQGQFGYFALATVEGNEAILQSGTQRYRVALADMAQAWDGGAIIAWKPPALDIDILTPGTRGASVVWLRRNLDKVLGEVPLVGPSNVYDTQLLQRVKAFQRSRALKEDGLAGALTLIHLIAAVGDPTLPTLTTTSQS